MKPLIHEIPFRGLTLEVIGYYSKEIPRTMEYPGDSQEFEIHKVKLNGTDISVLFEDFETLELITLNEHYS